MKKNRSVTAMLFLVAGHVLLAVSRNNINAELAGFCLGACVPMLVAAIVGFIIHIKNSRSRPDAQ